MKKITILSITLLISVCLLVLQVATTFHLSDWQNLEIVCGKTFAVFWILLTTVILAAIARLIIAKQRWTHRFGLAVFTITMTALTVPAWPGDNVKIITQAVNITFLFPFSISVFTMIRTSVNRILAKRAIYAN